MFSRARWRLTLWFAGALALILVVMGGALLVATSLVFVTSAEIAGSSVAADRVQIGMVGVNVPIPVPRFFTVSVEGGMPEPMPIPRVFQGKFSPDGQRFVMVDESEAAPPVRLNLVLNWFRELEQRVPRH